MIDDVVVGSVGTMTFTNWHADVEVSVNPTSSCPPTRWPPSVRPACWARCTWLSIRRSGKAPSGRLAAGRHDPAGHDRRPTRRPSRRCRRCRPSSTAAGSARSATSSTTSTPHSPAARATVRDLITRLDNFVGIARRASATTSSRRSRHWTGWPAPSPTSATCISQALHDDSARAGRADQGAAQLTTALEKLRRVQRHRDRTGQRHPGRPGAPTSRTWSRRSRRWPTSDRTSTPRSRTCPTFPFTQNIIDRAVRGDYMNLFAIIDLTDSPTEADAVPGHPLERRGRATGSRSRRSVLPATTPTIRSVRPSHRRRRRSARGAGSADPHCAATGRRAAVTRTAARHPSPARRSLRRPPDGRAVADAHPVRPNPVDHLHDRFHRRDRA